MKCLETGVIERGDESYATVRMPSNFIKGGATVLLEREAEIRFVFFSDCLTMALAVGFLLNASINPTLGFARGP